MPTHMKTSRTLLVLVLLSAVSVPWHTAQAQFQQIIESTLKPGQEPVYESFIKTMVEAANKVGSPVNWLTYRVAVGKNSPTYRLVLPFSRWADRDSWAGARATLVKAYGQQEADRIWGRLATSVQSSSDTIWQRIPEVSANVTPGRQVAKIYQVIVREVRRDRVAEYGTLQRMYTAAYEAAPSKPVVLRSVLRYGPGNDVTFRRTQGFNNWAELDGWNAVAIIQNHYRDEGAITPNQLNRLVVRQERFISVYRPDLSRPAN